MTGNRPERLDITCPALFEQLWSDFMELHGSRSSSGFGMNPISYNEIAQWNALLNKNVTSSDVEIIKALDNIYLEFQVETMRQNG